MSVDFTVRALKVPEVWSFSVVIVRVFQSLKYCCMVRFPRVPGSNPEFFFNVVEFQFRLKELGISSIGMKISLKSVKIWLRYKGLKLTQSTSCNKANSA